jgi:hypothetical protein
VNVALSEATSHHQHARTSSAPLDVEQAEAALVEHYPRLVRLAYLVTQPTLGRHRRVLAAHALVQRALPRGRTVSEPVPLPAQRTRERDAGSGVERGGQGAEPGVEPGGRAESAGHAYACVRLRVLRAALTAERPRRIGPLRLRRNSPPAGFLPRVFGLRLFPRTGGADELALDQTMSQVSGAARAACALRGLEGMAEADVLRTLSAAGAADPAEALAEADTIAIPAGSRDQHPLASAEFDPCSLTARPTDLMRRRQHGRAALAAVVAVLVCGGLLGLPGDTWGPSGAAAPAYSRNPAAEKALDPGELTRVEPAAWKHSARTDFSAWPARGPLRGDKALLRRALAVWARPGPEVAVSATRGTPTGPPAGPPQLLYAGRVDGASVVLFNDGLRIVRYAEPRGADSGAAALDLARTDGAGAADSGALVVYRSDSNVRYLTAPWVRRAASADLLRPTDGGSPLRRNADGVTGPLTGPGNDPRECGHWPGLLLSARSTGGASGSRLYTDLGELTPVRLTAGAPDGGDGGGAGGGAGSSAGAGTGDGGGQQDATGPEARAGLARTVCGLRALTGTGVRAVNSWEFARQALPENGGVAAWICARAETWRGTGTRVFAGLQPPARNPHQASSVVARAEDSPACGARQPRVLSGALWKSRADHWYLLGAGSGEVTAISARAAGGVSGSAVGRTLALRVKPGTRSQLTARLANGSRLRMLR